MADKTFTKTMKAIWAYMMRNEVGSWGRGAVISFSIF
jgi:hypothetical protein